MTTQERKSERLNKAIEKTKNAINRLQNSLNDESVVLFEGRGDETLGLKKLNDKISNLESKIHKYKEKLNNL